MRDNPVVCRCSACEKPMHVEVPGWRLNALCFVVWMGFGLWLVQDWPVVAMLVVIAPLSIVWRLAENRTYHAFWRWRHPLRCQGGHAEPEPEPA